MQKLSESAGDMPTDIAQRADHFGHAAT